MKETRKTKLKQSNGITLISLVITIIVLLILAGVSIAMLTGENGILTQATNAGEETEESTAKEKLLMALNEYQIQKYTPNSKDIVEFLEDHVDGFDVEGTTSPYDVFIDGYMGEVEENGDFDEDTFGIAGPRPTISNISITTDGTTVPTDNSLELGTPVQVTFDSTIEGGTIKSVTPSVPYTTNGTDMEITFTIVGTVNGVDYTKKQTVTLTDKYEKQVVAFSETENVVIQDDLGNDIKVPAGFGLAKDSGKDITEGIVIEEAGVPGGGNQFVWVPVNDVIIDSAGTTKNIQLSRYEFSSTGAATIKGNEDIIGSYYKETTEGRGNAVATDLNDFITKTNQAGGYYIARYEASSSDGTQSGTAESKENKTGWAEITQPNAATAAKTMYTSSLYTTDLVNSLAWDTALVYIQTISTDTNYSIQTAMDDGLQLTGNSGDEILKINDMASNLREWSTETSAYSEHPCIHRGGTYYNDFFPSSFRFYDRTSLSHTTFSFRPILYL